MKKYDVVAVVGEYEKEGQKKKQYMNCGVVVETEKGLSLKLNAVPVGSNGWFGLYEPQESSRKPENKDEEDDTIPF